MARVARGYTGSGEVSRVSQWLIRRNTRVQGYKGHDNVIDESYYDGRTAKALLQLLDLFGGGGVAQHGCQGGGSCKKPAGQVSLVLSREQATRGLNDL